MKKTFIIISFSVLSLLACKKKSKDVSQVVTASYPTVTLTGDQFYSILVGGTLPDVGATAYDSVLHESYTTSIDNSALDNSTPGLYIVKVNAKNKYGYVGSTNVYIAVTDVDDAVDLSGPYERQENGDTVYVSKIARGLYLTDNLGGAPSLPVAAYFAQTSDTTIDIPLQPTDNVGDIAGSDATLSLTPPDTVLHYKVVNGFFGTSFRTFIKVH